jgi:hypothetical protein
MSDERSLITIPLLPLQPAEAINKIEHHDRNQRHYHGERESFVIASCLNGIVDRH